ncbi:MAG: ROK family protein, partial [Acidobacteria bacterium]|nr:ROK family protein [Acidobacteriota bacterium]
MALLAAGVDVGGTKIEAVLLDDHGVVVNRTRHATAHTVTTPPGSATADVIAQALDDLVGSDVDTPVGLGLPGMMTIDGRLAYAPNLQSANGADFVSLMASRRPGQRIVCANDADCAAVAEHHTGAARGVDNFVMVTLGTGIGGGIFSHGHLVRGQSGFAGEIGHMVVDPRGPRCPCGQRGCWERFASGAGVARLAREAAAAGRLPELVRRRGDVESIRGEDVTEAAAEGLPEALAVVDEVGWWLALGVANLAA